MTTDDADAIRKQVAEVEYLAVGVSSQEQVIAGNQNWSTSVQGTDVEYPFIRFWSMQYGEFFTTAHVDNAAKVAVLGSIVSAQLFGEHVDPVGEAIRIRNQIFRVIGVMAAKGPGAFGEDQDDTILAPYTTVQKKLLGRGATSVQDMAVSAASPDDVSRVAEEIEGVLRIQHTLLRGEEDDFSVRTMEDIASIRTQTTETMTGLLGAIAAVSLVVGGIGILNIMLVSVTERTREIGLRLAIGARSRDVLLQFLVEALALSMVGGLIGVALGFSVSWGLTAFLQWPTAIPVNAVLEAVGFAAATGTFFGFYPARRAARLDPIEALRFE